MREEQKGNRTQLEARADDSSILQIRLNSDYIIQKIYTFLSGFKEVVLNDENGNPYLKSEKISEPLANSEGIHAIINYIQGVINPQVVQGNFTRDQYDYYIAEVHDGLIVDIMNNLHNWGINEDNYEVIINFILNLIQPFISRLIENKERESYAATIKAVESNTLSQSRAGLFK